MLLGRCFLYFRFYICCIVIDVEIPCEENLSTLPSRRHRSFEITPDLIQKKEDKENFEGMIQSIVLDVLMNHKNLYQLGANEHQPNSEATHN